MNIAFAGLRHNHIFGLYSRAKETDGICITGAWEADDTARREAQKVITEPFYDSLEALLEDPSVDAVAVGDYYGARGQIILKALKAGKHVIADKPLCTSLDELNAIRALSLEKQLKVACMLDLRYDGAVRTAREMILSGKLGKIHSMNFTGQHPLSYGTRPGWYFEPGKHGGTINDIAIHGIDALGYMTGLDFTAPVAARTWNAFAGEVPFFNDCAQFMAEFEGSAGVIADVSYAAQTQTAWDMPSYWRFTIWGEEGCLEFKFGEDHLIYAGRDSQQIETIPCAKVKDNWLTDFVKPFDAAAVLDVLSSSEAVLRIQRMADEAKKGK